MELRFNGDSNMRKLPLALACALIFGSSSVFAMGLGELQTQSNLNQPLRAMIPITDVRPGDLDTLSVKIGDEAQFARHGYSLMSVYGRIKLQVVGGQRPHILLTSDSPVRDPVVGLVLEIDGPSGTIERAVSILLDPEGYTPMAVVRPAAGRASAQEAVSDAQPRDRIYAAKKASTRRAAPVQSVPMPDGGDYTAVKGDTAYGIALRVRPQGVSLQQTIDTILQNNPHAFANPADADTLLAGKTLTIPNAQAMRQAPPVASVADKPIRAEAVPAAQAVTPAAAPVDTQEPRLDIVQPTTPAAASVPVVAAPVVGEVVSGPAGAPATATDVGSQSAPQPASIPAEVQEQIEAGKVENERLTGLLASQDQRLQKMEELLRLNETLIKEMEKKLNAAPAAPVAAPVNAAAPWWSYGLMGLGALLAAVLAFVAGSRRRPTDASVKATEQSAPRVDLAKPVEAMVAEPAVTAPAVATAAAVASADVIENKEDPIKAALEESDVMQAYGLHDRAIQVLSDALLAHPGNAALMARRARAMHEAGDSDGFLREAQAFRERHPRDEVQWAELRALGETHYPTSPLFGAVAASALMESSAWAQPSVASTESDEASALIQPLDSLDLGAPDAALDELLSSQRETQPAAASLDMPLLELDLPAVANLNKSPDEAVYALDTAASGNVEDFFKEFAPLDLPSVGDATPVWGIADAPVIGEAQEVSADDLAMLGIEPQGVDADAMALASFDERAAEPEFAEDMQAAKPGAEPIDLSLDFISSPSPLESVQDTSALSLELEPVSAVLENRAAIEPPLELSIDMPATAPMPGLQEEAPAYAPMPSSGMVSEHEVKLDIASAYMDMGDSVGAREMLEEVLASNCDELLKDRASQMLAHLSA
ncbi:MAG: hypothetical protein B7Y40_07955 [Gammaproteobacteria bacterium 28-57-27]|nr:MAG: hypothetical protein B7Y40_07955 [Gammaproteobacteria bacterium 28-57-27]